MTTRMQASARRAAQLLAALAEPEGRADPYPLYDQLRALGPVVAAPDGVLVVTGYRACSALLRDRRLRKAPERALAAAGYRDWRDRPSLRLLYTSIMMLDPSAHARLRRDRLKTSSTADLAAPENLQMSCLQLGFYLASWGMLRGH